MMEKRDMSGVLFKNDRKESPKHPDYTGNATIHGKDFWLSAWIKEGKKGKFMSLAVKPKDEQRPSVEKSRPIKNELNDEIPF